MDSGPQTSRRFMRGTGHPDRSMRAKSLTLAAMSVGYGVVQLDVTTANTALSSIGSSLGGVGARKIFMAGFAVFTAASLACALAPTATTLIAARAVQGAGAAILVPNSLALLNHAYPDQKERGPGARNLGGRGKPCSHGGPPAGGCLIALVGWRSIFVLSLYFRTLSSLTSGHR